MPISPGSDRDLAETLTTQVKMAQEARASLHIQGGRTRAFYGRDVVGEALDLTGHRGVIDYDPSEMVITARAGTPLAQIENLLDTHNQMLAFEPPRFGAADTIGGAVATGLSGPRRPFAGALRDYVLGARILNGHGEVLRFGGTVFKNVAGFDAFRLMAGAQGCLGVILDVSLRVVPKPRVQTSLVFQKTGSEAQTWLTGLMRRPLPLSGAFYDGRELHLRLSGGEAAVKSTIQELGGDAENLDIWPDVANASHPTLTGSPVLWRISLPQAATPPELADAPWDWAGGIRWLKADEVDPAVWDMAAQWDGHATVWRGPRDQVFQPLAPAILQLHRRIKAAMDPVSIFNPGRTYEGL